MNGDTEILPELLACLDIDHPKSFFLYAGAGSGKTRALVNALKYLNATHGDRLRLLGKRIAVITYTNAACDEINRRLMFDPLFAVSTIHSFVWEEVVKGFNSDIREWLRENLEAEIADLEDKQARGRSSTASEERAIAINSKRKRLDHLESVLQFVYNPNGENLGKNSLNHVEVIKLGAYFLEQKTLSQKFLIQRFPFLFVDESQDTNQHLMDALLVVERTHVGQFGLGLFGDTMQRIYSDGKVNLGHDLPGNWATPALKTNFRCPERVVALINDIRSSVDDHMQLPKTNAVQGCVRLFIVNSDAADKKRVEDQVRREMSNITGDSLWNDQPQVKTLTLEHHMAAQRLGFHRMFEPLHSIKKFKTGLLDGSLPIVRVFSQMVFPLLVAKRDQDEFAVAAIVRQHSPLLDAKAFEMCGNHQLQPIAKSREAVDALLALWGNESSPTFLQVLKVVQETGLFLLPEHLIPFAMTIDAETQLEGTSPDGSEPVNDNERQALREFLNTPFDQIEQYSAYINDQAPFGTHQGVKGLEFPRVLVVIDDEQSRGFMFDFEKLFGVKDKTRTDLENERKGNETGIDRTRRLFYVTCSRAEESLAVVVYSATPTAILERVVKEGWFSQAEIEVVNVPSHPQLSGSNPNTLNS